MHRDHGFRFPFWLVVLGWLGSTALGADSPAEETLKSKGLTKATSTWVIADEKPVLDGMKEARAVFQSYALVADRQAGAVQMAAQSKQLDAQRVEIQNNLNVLNQQIAQMPNPGAGMPSKARRFYQQTPANNPLLAERSQLNAALAEVNQTQKNIKAQIPAPKDKANLDAEVSKKFEAFKTTLTDLRKQVDEVSKKYADLAADESVKKSIEELTKTAHTRVKLGPSEPFLTIIKEVDHAERRYLGKTDPTASGSTKKKAKAKK